MRALLRIFGCGCSLLALLACGEALGQPAQGVIPQATPVAGSSLVLPTFHYLYGLQVTAGSSAGFVEVFDAVAVPADGTVAPLKCAAVAAGATVGLAPIGASEYFRNGVVVVFSTGSGCFTKTASATAFISADGS